VAGVKMLDETVPIYLNSAFGTATNSMMAFGIMVAILLAVGLPENDDKEGQLEDSFWRVIYGFPYLLQAIMVLCLCTCYR
jgi:amino acid transporter